MKILVSMDVRNRRPSLIFQLGNVRADLSVEEARLIGQQLIGLATEAEIQGFLLDWMTQHFGQLTVDQATALAMQFRQYLAQQRGAGRGEPGPGREEGGPPRLDP